MSSSMLSGGAGRTYAFDIENIITCPSTTTTSSRTSHSSSPSSTLSGSINSPIAISNRKARTPRKRPNQTYNEAAVLLSIACPKVFSTKNVTNKNKNKNKNVPTKISHVAATKQQIGNSFRDPLELLLPFPAAENSRFLLCRPIREKLDSGFESKVSLPEVECLNWDSGMEFNTQSMLDEEIGEGIDSIMGISNSTTEKYEENDNSSLDSKTCYGFPMGLGFGGNLEFNFGIGMRNGIRALKSGNGGNWWGFPAVNVVNVSSPVAASVAPVEVKKVPVEKKKLKKVEELMKRPESESELGEGNSGVGCKLLLKLNYDDVLNAWSDKGSPLRGEVSGSESIGGDIHRKLAEIDLFSENGATEVGAIRYKEEKCTRVFSKNIRYQIRKINADRRPRYKGRFMRKPNSPTCDDT